VALMFARIDAWLAKYAFHPPIIWFCQITRQTQYAASRLFWFTAMLMIFYRASGFWMQVFMGIICLSGMLSASLRANEHTESWSVMRRLWLFLLALDTFLFIMCVTHGVKINRAGLNVAIDIVVLFAEYAATIKTIPPRKTRERKVSGKAVRA
jgi:hypothetical protein